MPAKSYARFTIHVSSSMLKWLNAQAKRHEMSKAAIIRVLVEREMAPKPKDFSKR